MQPFLAVATVVAALAVAVNSETSYALQPIARSPRAGISTGWGWRPVKTFTIALPSLTKGWGSGGGGGGGGGGGWGWGKKPSGISFGVYGGLRIGPKQQGWGWQPQKQQGWGWQPQKQQGWGWQPQKQQGWGWQPQKQHGWGWGGDDSDEYDDRALSAEEDEEEEDDLAYDEEDASSEEDPYDDASDESDESAEDDEPLDLRNAISYPPVY